MASINPTVIATSLPRNLATGLAFFPANTSLQNPALPQFIGWDESEPEFGEDLLNLRIPLLLFRLRTRVSARFIAAAFIGYNLQYTIQGDVPAGTGQGNLFVSQDASEGGAGMGLGWDLKMTFGLDTAAIRFTWRSGFRTTWQEAFSFDVDASIDLIALAVKILEKAGFAIAMKALAGAREFAGNKTFWGLHDRVSNQFPSKGYLELKPKVALHGNLLDAAAAISGKVKAFLKGLKAIGIKPAAGPVLNIYFPVKMEVVRLTTEYGNYDIRDGIPGGQSFATYVLRKVDGPPVPANAPPIQNASVIHTHNIDIKIGLAIKIKIKFWSVFSQEVSIPIDLTEFVPALRGSTLTGNSFAGPYFNRLSAMGAGTSPEVEMPEVIWG